MSTGLNSFLYQAKSSQENRNHPISAEGISPQGFATWMMGKWRIPTWAQRQHQEQLQEVVTALRVGRNLAGGGVSQAQKPGPVAGAGTTVVTASRSSGHSGEGWPVGAGASGGKAATSKMPLEAESGGCPSSSILCSSSETEQSK